MIDWSRVERVLVIKLRSIGDTVLATPSLVSLRRFLPHAQIDILLEDWVAPVLEGSEAVDNVIVAGSGTLGRMKTAMRLRQERYDVVFNQHGGTTATLLTRATGARHRVGYSHYQYSFLHNELFGSPVEFWQRNAVHSAEQQLALLGNTGVPVEDRPKSRLRVTDDARSSVLERLATAGVNGPYALLHPTTAFFTKQWAVENFARVSEFLDGRGMSVVATGSRSETETLKQLRELSSVPVTAFDDLSLPEVTALPAGAELFVGNDSGMAHIAAAVSTPSVVIFGSSNRNHWYPWTDAPNEIVYTEFACQPCAGYLCKEFGEPRCILEVPVSAVVNAIKRVLVQ